MKNWAYRELEGLSTGDLASTSDWFDARAYSFLLFLVKWPAAGSGAGVFRIEATAHEGKEAATIEDVTASITTTYGAWPSITLLTDSCTIPIANPFPFMRLCLDMSIVNAERAIYAYAFGRKES